MTKPRHRFRTRRRFLRNEVLEPRLLLANDFPFQNPGQRFDVNRDLAVSALDVLQIINLIGRNGGDIALEGANTGTRFPDVNGTNSVTSLDALQIINRLDSTFPIPAARLVSDSARGGVVNLDFVTNQYGLEFGISFGVGPQQLELRIDGGNTDPFVNVGSLTGSEHLTLGESQLDAIAGSPLGDGDHRFEIRVAGEERVQAFEVTIDTTSPLPPTQVRLTPATDSGASDSDGVTNIVSPDVQGEAETGSLVEILVNGQPAGRTIANSPWQIENITLAEGPNAISVSTSDIAGNQSDEAAASIELDTVAPATPTFDLSAEYDTDVLGDQTTKRDFVTLVGQADPLTLVRFPSRDREEVSRDDGSFKLFGVPLKLGSNPLSAHVEDLAGNENNFSVDVIRQAKAGFLILQESSGLVVEQSQTVDLSPITGSRTLRFEIDTGFDTTDDSAAIEDLLAIYLVDPANSSTTILDRGEPGTALFTLAGDTVDLVPGRVRFDGKNVEIDVSGVTGFNQGQLLFQLINSDTDTRTQVGIGPIANEVESGGTASPVFPSRHRHTLAGEEIDLNALNPALDVELQVRNVRLDSSSGHYAAELSLQNNGMALGSNLAVVLAGLPDGVSVSDASGVDGNGDPYFNFAPAVAGGGLDRGASTVSIHLQIDDPSLTSFSLHPIVLSGGPNRAPQLDPIDPLTVMPGEVVKVPLSASDPDGDAIAFSILGELPTSRLTSDSHLILTPNPTEIGNYTFDLIASDGVSSATQTVTVDVVADTDTSTRISGLVLNTNLEPLPGLPVELGTEQTTTSADGSFTLTLPAGLLSDTLKVRGEAFAGPEIYPFIAEKLPLILPQGVFENVNNVVSRPIYLPALDVAGGTTIDPAQDMTVGAANIPGIELFVGAGTLRNQQGGLYDEVLSITEVPVDLTPAALPPNLLTELVVTIQPGEMVFDIPAPLTFPNRSGLDPGTLLDLYSINPVTGQFDLVGKSQVSSDGSVIEPIWGGVRNSSWHLVSEEGKDPNDNPRKHDVKCNECVNTVNGNSEIATHSGALIEFHPLVPYQSLGQRRGLTLVYDSERADPRPIVPFGYDNVTFDPNDRLVARVDVRHGASRTQVPGIAPGGLAGVQGGENFWTIPAAGGSISASLQIDMTQMPTGQYHYDQSTGILRLGDNSLNGTMVDASSDFIHVNSTQSSFGAGWGLSGLSQIIGNDDGSMLLVDGDGGESLFEPPMTPGGPFVSPAGDFSVLELLPGGTLRRTFPDQSVESYDASGRLSSFTDKNNLTVSFAYDTSDRLTTVTDPANLVTTLTYTGDHVTSIVDPANRVTQFDYDASGNLIRITDPDGASRSFEYDGRHHLISETDKRGFREQVSYGFHGRVESVTRGDGTQLFFDPLQTQGLSPPGSTSDPLNPPAAISDEGPITAVSDPNSDVAQRVLDRAGQLVSLTDDIGASPQVFRDADNLVRTVTDARGNITFFDYDDRGNLVSTVDSEDRPVILSGSIETPGKRDFYEFELTAATGLYVDAISELTTDPTRIHIELQKQFGSQWLFVAGADLDDVDANGVTDEDVVTFLTPGHHRLVIRGVGDHTGDYALAPQSSTAGIPISLGQLVSGTTEFPSSSELFTLHGDENEQWFFTSELVGGSSGAFARVLDPTGSVLDRFALTNDGSLITLSRDGIHTILVEGDLNSSDETRFAFTVHPFNTEPRVAQLNQPIAGAFDYVGEVNRFELVVADEALVRVDSRARPNLVSFSLSGPTGVVIAPQPPELLEVADGALLLQPGIYQIEIKAFGGTGAYDVRLIDLFQTPSIVVGDRVSGANSDGRATDIYQFDATAGDEFDITLHTRTNLNPPNTRVRVLDVYGKQLLNQPLQSLNGNGNFATDLNGPLFVAFVGPINATTPDFFNFDVTRLGNTPPPGSAGIPLVLNQETTGQATSGNNVVYEFTLSERSLLRLDPRTADSSVRATLTGGPGVLLDDDRLNFNRNDRWFNLPAGDYHLELRTTDAVGDFTFALLHADSIATDITNQIGSPIDIDLPSESSELFRLELSESTSLLGLSLGFTSTAGNWSLSNEAGRVIVSDTFAGRLEIGQLDPGTYFLVVDHLSETAAPVPFRFVLHERTRREFDVNLGDTIAGDLNVDGDTDTYQITVIEPSTVHVNCQLSSAVRFSLNGPTGTLFDGASLTTCSYERVDISHLTFDVVPGVYTARIESIGTAASSYEINLIDASTLLPSLERDFSGTLLPFETMLIPLRFDPESAVVLDSIQNDPNTIVELLQADGSDLNPNQIFDFNRNIPTNIDRFTPLVDRSVTLDGDYHLVIHNPSDTATNYHYALNDADSVVTVATLGTTYDVTIDQAGQTHVFQYDLPTDSLLLFDSLVSSDPTLAWTLQCGSRTVANGSFQSQDFFQSLIDIPACSAQLLIHGDDVDDTGSVSFNLDQIPAGDVISSGEIVADNFASGKETVFRQIAVNAGDTLSFDAIDVGAVNFNPQWSAFDAQGGRLFLNDFTASPSADAGPFVMLHDGFVTIAIFGDNNADAAPSYSFRADVVPGVPLIDPSTPLAPDELISGEVSLPGESDLFRIDISQSSLLYFDSLTNNSQIRWTLLGPRGILVNNREFSRNDFELDPLQLTTGTYFLRVFGNGTFTGAYDFVLRDLNAAPELNFNVPVSGRLDPGMETDPFTFEVSAQQIENGLFFDSIDNASSDARVRLIDPFGEVLSLGLFRDDVSRLPIHRTGRHGLVIEGRSGGNSTDYSLEILALQAPMTSPIRVPTFRGTKIQYDPTFSIPTRITTSGGRTTRFDLDPQTGDVLRINRDGDDGFLAVDHFTYDAAGQVTSQIDGEGRRIDFEYDTLGRVVSITEAPGTSIEAVTGFEYDAAGNQTAIVTPRGGRIEQQFDPLNRRTRVEGPDPDAAGPLDGPIETFQYDAAGNLIRSRDPLNRETRLRYDARDRLVEFRDPLESATLFRYDFVGNNTEIIDRRGNSTLQEFDARGRLHSTTDALTNRSDFRYDADNNLTHVTNPLGEVTSFVYDARARIVTSTDPLGQSSQLEYDTDNLLVGQIDANGNPTRLDYDALGRLVTRVDALGQAARFQYDASDLTVRTTNEVGEVSVTVYDDRGRVIIRRDALGAEQQFEYDASGNLIASTDEVGNITTFEYDLLERRTGRTDPDPDGLGPLSSPVTAFTYDIAGNLTSRTDAVGNTTAYQYDSLNRVVVETDPRTQVRTFSYDAVGNLLDRTDRNGRLTRFEYDALNRQVSETWLDGSSLPVHQFDFSYDPVGRLLSAADVDTAVNSSYDAAGRPVSVTQVVADAPVVSLGYSYDAFGNRTQSRETIDSLAAGQTDYVYDPLHRINRIEQLAQSGAVNPVAEKRVDLLYNAIGQFDRITRFADLAGQTQTTDSHYTYDGLSRLASITHRDATDAVLATYNYQYDAASRITQIIDIDGTTGYTYDGLSRLIAADSTDDARDESYAFDTAGNRTSSHLHDSDYVTETSNRLTGDGTFTYDYDAEGNLVSRTDINSGELREFEYDHRNRLTRVTDRASNGGVITAETTYQYDAFNRRVGKHHDADGTGSQDPSSEYYFHDGDQIVLEFTDADGPSGAAVPILAARNLYGPGIDFLLAVEKPQHSQVLWTLVDHQNSVRDIVNSDGSQHNHVIYDSYGNVIAQTTPDLVTRFLYTGRELETETGLYYYRERYYDPAIGRFMNEDPIGFDGSDHQYSYVNADPLNNTDPFGRRSLANIAAQSRALRQVFIELVDVNASLRETFGENSPVFQQFDRTGRLLTENVILPTLKALRQLEKQQQLIELQQLTAEVVAASEAASETLSRSETLFTVYTSPAIPVELIKIKEIHAGGGMFGYETTSLVSRKQLANLQAQISTVIIEVLPTNDPPLKRGSIFDPYLTGFGRYCNFGNFPDLPNVSRPTMEVIEEQTGDSAVDDSKGIVVPVLDR